MTWKATLVRDKTVVRDHRSGRAAYVPSPEYQYVFTITDDFSGIDFDQVTEDGDAILLQEWSEDNADGTKRIVGPSSIERGAGTGDTNGIDEGTILE